MTRDKPKAVNIAEDGTMTPADVHHVDCPEGDHRWGYEIGDDRELVERLEASGNVIVIPHTGGYRKRISRNGTGH